jgi:hypothetical protein
LNARGLPQAIHKKHWGWLRRSRPDGYGQWNPVPTTEIEHHGLQPGDGARLPDGSVLLWCRDPKDGDELDAHIRRWQRRGKHSGGSS